MMAYALAFVILLRVVRRRRMLPLLSLLTAFVLFAALLIQLNAPSESPALLAAEITRYYWFLSQWRWYELLGIIAPLIIFAVLQRRRRIAFSPAATTLCRACIALGLIATLVALLFARENLATHLIAHLQPLRVFVLLYALMAMLLGAALQQICFTTLPRAFQLRAMLRAVPFAVLIALAGSMFDVQRSAFPASLHIELPNRPNPNPWTQAFLWARDHTPRSALFAIDADYITTPGEDAQTFRSTAQRSILPDHSKAMAAKPPLPRHSPTPGSLAPPRKPVLAHSMTPLATPAFSPSASIGWFCMPPHPRATNVHTVTASSRSVGSKPICECHRVRCGCAGSHCQWLQKQPFLGLWHSATASRTYADRHSPPGGRRLSPLKKRSLRVVKLLGAASRSGCKHASPLRHLELALGRGGLPRSCRRGQVDANGVLHSKAGSGSTLQEVIASHGKTVACFGQKEDVLLATACASPSV